MPRACGRAVSERPTRQTSERTAPCRKMSATEEATGTGGMPAIEEGLSVDEAQARLQALQQVCQELTRKINELDMDRTEHGLVIDALKPLDGGRKCFRMVGDVVVERTIDEVAPAVLKNRDAIVETMNKMGEAASMVKVACSQQPHAATHRPRSPPVAQGYRLGSERRSPAAWMPKRGRRGRARARPHADLTAFGHSGTGAKAEVRRRVFRKVQGDRAEPAASRR